MLAVLALLTAAHASPFIAVWGECPGLVTIDVYRMTPGGQMGLMWGIPAGEGGDGIYAGPVCSETSTNLYGPEMGLVATDLDGDGSIRFTRYLGPAACGFGLDAIDVATCETTFWATSLAEDTMVPCTSDEDCQASGDPDGMCRPDRSCSCGPGWVADYDTCVP